MQTTRNQPSATALIAVQSLFPASLCGRFVSHRSYYNYLQSVYCSISGQSMPPSLLLLLLLLMRDGISCKRVQCRPTGIQTAAIWLYVIRWVDRRCHAVSHWRAACNIRNIAAGHACASSDCLFFVDRPNIVFVASTNWLDWIHGSTARSTGAESLKALCHADSSSVIMTQVWHWDLSSTFLSTLHAA